jgi:hypothetical protein
VNDFAGDMAEAPTGLRATLEAACADEGCSMKDLTVLANQHDPFRIDTPAAHRDGEWLEWLAVQAEELGLGHRTIHLRGLHYMLVSGEVIKPKGEPYRNTSTDWAWLEERAAKAARWLKYIPFEQIVDHRNSPPVLRPFEPSEPWPFVDAGVEIEIVRQQLEPQMRLFGFRGVQPNKLVLIGEKSSLEEVLGPIAERYQADLYLPTGEPSDTLLHRMARDSAEDGRHMVVLYFSDCDPSGWQMPVSVARKLQALEALHFPQLDFEVRRVALTPDQVREYGLPSTPLKDTEQRADRWQKAMGVEQTEIDALAALQPDLLRQIALEAIAPFHDDTLLLRVVKARREWETAAQELLDEQMNHDDLAAIREKAERMLVRHRREVREVNDALRIDIGDSDLPPVEIPEPEIGLQPTGEPLIDSAWSFAEQSRRLKADKEYDSGVSA